MLMQSPSLLHVCVSALKSFECPTQIFMKHGLYNMAPEYISTAHFICSSHQSACVFVSLTKMYPSFDARLRLVKQFLEAMNTWYNKGTVGHIFFYSICVLSKDCLWVCLFTFLSLLRKNSGKMF